MDAVAYYRLSKDRKEQTSIERQRIACRAYAKARGWTIIAEHSDVDLSGFRDVARPGWDAALGAVSGVRGRVLLAWKSDRMARRLREFERLLDLSEAHGFGIACVEDSFDATSPGGRAMARVVSTFAQYEAEQMSARIVNALDHRAKLGKPHGGGLRRFGYTDDWALEPVEAALVVEAFDRVIGGDSLRSVVLDWQDRGIRTVTGGWWSIQGLRQMVTSARYAAIREHHGDVVADGTWPAIVTADVVARARALLADPARRPRPRRNEWLLTGLVRCGVCGAALVGWSRSDRLDYYCPPRPHGCGAVVMKAERLDEHVLRLVFSARNHRRLGAARRPPGPTEQTLRRAVEAEERKRDELAADLGTILSREEWLIARAPVLIRLDAARRALASHHAPVERLEVFAGRNPADVWAELSHDRRRAALRALLDRIVLHPSGRNRWMPMDQRVTITWRR